MAYVRSASAQKMVDEANTKMVVYYRDNNTRTWWGRPRINNNRFAADPFTIELRRHHKYVAKTAASIKVAIIYNKHTGQEEQRFDGKQGRWV